MIRAYERAASGWIVLGSLPAETIERSAKQPRENAKGIVADMLGPGSFHGCGCQLKAGEIKDGSNQGQLLLTLAHDGL
jgi:hypothetical protein